MKLICFPYAGGQLMAYLRLKKELSTTSVRVVPFELPGRGLRAKEPLLRSMDAVLDDYMRQLRPHLAHPFAFYGHSMGALVAHLLTLRLGEMGLRRPEHLFLSAKAAPSSRGQEPFKYTLPERDFKEYLLGLGGAPRELFDDPDSLNFFCNILRADFEALETCDERMEEVHDIPVTAFAGKADGIPVQCVRDWQNSVWHPMRFHAFEGDHFFILSHWPAIANIIDVTLAPQVEFEPIRRMA